MRSPLLFLAFLAVAACTPPPVNRTGATLPETEKTVDLTRYQGLWYEIARYPNSFEEGCEGVTAEYALREDGRVSVTNTCRKGAPGGPADVAEGVARIVDADTNAKLKVRFAPAWIPFAEGDYWILELDEDYQTVLVGSPDGRYLWILARQAVISDDRFEAMKQAAKSRGYDTTALRPTAQPPG